MQVIFETRDPDAAALRGLVERRVHFVMRRVSAQLARVRVLLSDVNGPRGGVDKHCLLELKTDRGGTLHVSALATDWRVAINDALARAGNTLGRNWQRKRRVVRERSSEPDTL